MSTFARFNCSICLDWLDDSQRNEITNCGHVFHSNCIRQCLKSRHKVKCASCREEVGEKELKGIYFSSAPFNQTAQQEELDRAYKTIDALQKELKELNKSRKRFDYPILGDDSDITIWSSEDEDEQLEVVANPRRDASSSRPNWYLRSSVDSDEELVDSDEEGDTGHEHEETIPPLGRSLLSDNPQSTIVQESRDDRPPLDSVHVSTTADSDEGENEESDVSLEEEETDPPLRRNRLSENLQSASAWWSREVRPRLELATDGLILALASLSQDEGLNDAADCNQTVLHDCYDAYLHHFKLDGKPFPGWNVYASAKYGYVQKQGIKGVKEICSWQHDLEKCLGPNAIENCMNTLIFEQAFNLSLLDAMLDQADFHMAQYQCGEGYEDLLNNFYCMYFVMMNDEDKLMVCEEELVKDVEKGLKCLAFGNYIKCYRQVFDQECGAVAARFVCNSWEKVMDSYTERCHDALPNC
ncbi:hypothetical protein QR680_003662 [Steinernema hermaphroditum]|uniref:RING-type domain-containing protein n=1 Tax=Steinernema hermaphroditum TaxID=289476 RepID=A0AA39HMH8_9BILA|nr:hypothetical protein QR680_003662 [Steinernema hermaphroditum]